MALTLTEPPGFCDLDDSVLTAGATAFAIHVGRIAKNSEFGMARFEVFQGLYLHGEQVELPVSRIDGTNYERSELLYFWVVRHSVGFQRGGNNPVTLTDAGGNLTSTGWITPSASGQCLWFANWNVQQYDPLQAADSEWNKDAGKVYSEEWYRRSGDDSQKAKTTDGLLLVFTIAQRLKNTIEAKTEPTWANVDETLIAQDKPWTQGLARNLNENAKFSVLNTECFYLGEYTNGQTVSLAAAKSQADGHQYVLGTDDIKFMQAWRWTASANEYKQPPDHLGQMGPFFCSINPDTGAVTIWVDFIDDGLGFLEKHFDYGRVAVFAFCTRAGGPTTLPLANQFRQLDDQFFGPGEKLRASTVLAIKRNIDEAVLTPEFFGPTLYKDGDIIPLPVSTVDGYPYSRAELVYVRTYEDTTNQVGNNLRLPLFEHRINQSTGLVRIIVWRLPPGGPYVDDNNGLARLNVLICAFRQAELPELIDFAVNPPEQILPPPTTATQILGAAPTAEVDLAPTDPGDFTVAHSFGGTPALVLINMTSGGNIWFQSPTRYDGTNLYLSASMGGVTGKALLFDTAPGGEVALAPAADGDFAVAHSLGSTPGLVAIQMTSGGNIWGQNPTEADAAMLYETASNGGVTGNAELWLALAGNGSPSVRLKSIPITASAAGDFQIPHELGLTPLAVLINMNTPGFPAFWFQATRFDDVNIYLSSPGAGVSGFAEVLY